MVLERRDRVASPADYVCEWTAAARLAQSDECRSAEREVVSSNPGRTTNQGVW